MRHSQRGESKVQFYSSLVLDCNLYEFVKDEKKAQTVLDFIGTWKMKTKLQKKIIPLSQLISEM